MKETFPGYYQPTEEEFSEIWKNCIFVFDSNVLLNLYRYSSDTRDDLINILSEISERLWIPHQVAMEYLKDRLTVIQDQLNSYNKIREIVNKTSKIIEKELLYAAG